MIRSPSQVTSLFVSPTTERKRLRVRSQKKLYHVVVVFPNGLTRYVKVKASSREIAEQRALKFHPNAIGIKRDG